jgi:hypothetical protein
MRQIKFWRYEMKTIRSLTTLAGLSVAVLALGVTGANAQILSTSTFRGTFTLPAATQWGSTTLPAGIYTLQYGYLSNGQGEMVEIAEKGKRSPHIVVMAKRHDRSFASKSSLVCAREGSALVVRALEIAGLGTSVDFALPRGAKLAEHKRNHNGYTQLAEAPMLIERIPVN